ncbi:MAG TPA: uroporphyrinogen-III synthase [Myxococcales bacterium]|nr:uroporphyrinogen-III synthase [Myxococcales bacterium]
MIRIALFEARLSAEISELVRRSGGEPVCVPAVREQRKPAAAEVASLLEAVAAEPAPVFVFSTGVGVTALFDEARALGRAEELKSAIVRGSSVCRGPKPVAALHREGIAASIKASTPFTTAEFVKALELVELDGRFTVLLHYGERNQPLVEALQARGARLNELVLYEWELPEDKTSLVRMALELSQAQYAAAAFTSQIQARNLMTVAEHAGCREALVASLNSKVVVAAVGPTCARVLTELGVTPQVVPESPKMGPMVTALMARLTKDKAT